MSNKLIYQALIEVEFYVLIPMKFIFYELFNTQKWINKVTNSLSQTVRSDFFLYTIVNKHDVYVRLRQYQSFKIRKKNQSSVSQGAECLGPLKRLTDQIRSIIKQTNTVTGLKCVV